MASFLNKKLSPESVNAELAQMLLEIGEYEKNVNKQHFKYIAYRRAAHSINNCEKKITNLTEAQNLRGVGKRISEKIDEYLKTGTIQKFEKAKKSKEAVDLKDLIRVFGIGPSIASKLYKEGMRSIEDLKHNTDKLTEHQKIGLKYVYEFEKKISRDEINNLRDLLTREIESIDQKYHITFCGSYRRGEPTSSDIDILITHPNYVSETYVEEHKENTSIITVNHSSQNARHLLDKVINKLQEINFLTDTLSHGDKKYSGVYLDSANGIHHRIDIRIFPYDEYFCALLYFTGNDAFNMNLRKDAIQKGFTLNEYCLKKIDHSGNPIGKPLPVTCEQDVFDHIGVPYIPPEKRNY